MATTDGVERARWWCDAWSNLLAYHLANPEQSISLESTRAYYYVVDRCFYKRDRARERLSHALGRHARRIPRA